MLQQEIAFNIQQTDALTRSLSPTGNEPGGFHRSSSQNSSFDPHSLRRAQKRLNEDHSKGNVVEIQCFLNWGFCNLGTLGQRLRFLTNLEKISFEFSFLKIEFWKLRDYKSFVMYYKFGNALSFNNYKQYKPLFWNEMLFSHYWSSTSPSYMANIPKST